MALRNTFNFSTKGLLGSNLEDIKLAQAQAEQKRIDNLGELAMKNTNTPFYDKMLVETADRLGRGLFGMKSPEEEYAEAFSKRAKEMERLFGNADLTSERGTRALATSLAERGFIEEAANVIDTIQQGRAKLNKPAFKEVKEGNEIVTYKYNPALNDFEEYSRAPVNRGSKAASSIQKIDTGAEVILKKFDPNTGQLVEVGRYPKVRSEKLTATMEKELLEATNVGFDANNEAESTGALIKDLKKVQDRRGGVPYTIGEWIKDTAGAQDFISSLRVAVKDKTFKAAINKLPPGPATDKDVKLAMDTVPDDSWNVTQLIDWLEKYQLVQTEVARYNNAKADYIGENNDLIGFSKSYRTNSESRRWMDAAQKANPDATREELIELGIKNERLPKGYK